MPEWIVPGRGAETIIASSGAHVYADTRHWCIGGIAADRGDRAAADPREAIVARAREIGDPQSFIGWEKKGARLALMRESDRAAA